MIERPWASSARARADTSNALSVPSEPILAARRISRSPSRQELADSEHDVRRTLGQATHVPRVPELAVGNQGLHAVASGRQPVLLVLADPEQHLDLEAVAADPGRAHLIGDLFDQAHVVRSQAKADRPYAPVQQD